MSGNTPNLERTTNSSERGRGRGFGRGRGRGRAGRGRGRGRGKESGGVAAGTNPTSELAEANAGPSNPTRARERAPKPRLTHFLAIPLGHNAGVRDTFSAFTDALLAATPPVPGLDPTIVVPARRLHFTLGVMSLGPETPLESSVPGAAAAQDLAEKLPRTLEAAKSLLRAVKPNVMELLGEETLRVPLECMDIMKPERRDQERAHVMWVGPGDGPNANKFKQVADFVHRTFREAGLLVDEGRALKLHCTVLNTVYRKPKTKSRVPFSYPSVLASEASQAVLVETGVIDAGTLDRARKGPARVNFGEWDVNEIQICEMGSWGPEGEYVAVARQSLI